MNKDSHLFRNASLFSILTRDARTSGMLSDPNLLHHIVVLQTRPDLYDNLLKSDNRLRAVLEVLVDHAEKEQRGGAAAPMAAAPSLSLPDVWNVVRSGTEDEVRRTLNALGKGNALFKSTGPRGLTLLMEVASRKRRGEHLVAQLLSLGAGANDAGAARRTALHFAAASGNVSAIKELLAANADPTLRDESDAAPLELALTNGHEEAAALLIDAMEHEARVREPLPPLPPRAIPPKGQPSPSRSPLHVPPAASPPPPSPDPFELVAVVSTGAAKTAPTTTTTVAAATVLSTSAPVGGSGRTDDTELVRQLVVLEARVAELEAEAGKREKRITALEEELLCSVCLDRSVNTVLLECAHAVLCAECAAPLKTCPVCSKPISRLVRTFRA